MVFDYANNVTDRGKTNGNVSILHLTSFTPLEPWTFCPINFSTAGIMHSTQENFLVCHDYFSLKVLLNSIQNLALPKEPTVIIINYYHGTFHTSPLNFIRSSIPLKYFSQFLKGICLEISISEKIYLNI